MPSTATAEAAVLAVGSGWGWCTADKCHKQLHSCSFFFLQIKYGDTATSEGVLFATYSALIGESQAGGQHRTRLKQILDWCRENFDGVVSFKKNKTKQKRGELRACGCTSPGNKELGASSGHREQLCRAAWCLGSIFKVLVSTCVLPCSSVLLHKLQC